MEEVESVDVGDGRQVKYRVKRRRGRRVDPRTNEVVIDIKDYTTSPLFENQREISNRVVQLEKELHEAKCSFRELQKDHVNTKRETNRIEGVACGLRRTLNVYYYAIFLAVLIGVIALAIAMKVK
jgi:hypothetical protein